MVAFDLASYFRRLGATPNGARALRQDLVRGLKDYYIYLYGYDRYGAETIVFLSDRMARPFVYGFALQRIVHDRRLSDETKVNAVQYALDVADYGQDLGLPYGLLGGVLVLARFGCLDEADLRYALTLIAGATEPFRGLSREEFLEFTERLLADERLPQVERAAWAHTLVARHLGQSGAAALVDTVAGSDNLAVDIRRELCRAWAYLRQPRLDVEIPQATGTPRECFVAEHMPFWMAHLPSFPQSAMVRLGLVWSVRLGADPAELIFDVLTNDHVFADQVWSGVADILAENHDRMRGEDVRAIIAAGIRPPAPTGARRKFYRLGMELFGDEYRELAGRDSAGSVRRWAAKI